MVLLKLVRVSILAAFFLSHSMTSFAKISEIRVGISEFDERTLRAPLSAKRASENSLGVNFEILFGKARYLEWVLSPSPYIGGTVNLEGKTSYGGAGLLWRQRFSKKLYGDFSFGLVAHTGTKQVPEFQQAPDLDLSIFEGQSQAYNLNQNFRSEIQFGSRVLFREQVSLGIGIDENWSTEIFLEHLSNGQILSKFNEGVNIIGVRAAKKF